MIPAVFYDIESLKNLFTIACFTDADRDEDTKLDIYYLLDNDEDVFKGHEDDWKEITADEIYKDNQNFHGQISFYDLKDRTPNYNLCRMFSCDTSRFMNDKKESDRKNSYRMTDKNGHIINPFRIKCDTDSDYDENKDPYFFGYNSYQYDTTMLAHYFQEIWTPQYMNSTYPKLTFNPPTARTMRDFNNELFEPEYKSQMYTRLSNGGENYGTNEYRIRKNMLMSGRHVDVARLNEKQSKVGLKRLLGMLGFQILESSKLSDNTDNIENIEQFADLVAYNCSDVINLKGLFYHPQYQAQFELKRQLLKTYPELVYNKKNVSNDKKGTVDPETGRNIDYIPDAGNCANVKSNRLFIDSSSAQFSTNAFCPYDHLTDTPVVSFVYPSTAAIERAKKSGKKDIPEQKDVLEEVNDFFNESFKDEPKLRAQFNVIYQYYSWMRGKNFNDSNNYSEDYNVTSESDDILKNDTDTVRDMMNDSVHYFNSDAMTKLEEACVYKNDADGHAEKMPLTDVKLSDYYKTLRVHSLKEVDEFAQTITGHAYDENGNIMHEYDTPFDEFGTCIPYYDKDGNATSCFVLFSTGGIHGAEYNTELYAYDLAEWQKESDRLEEVKDFFDGDAVACRKMRKFTLDGEDEEIDYKPFLKSGRKVEDSEWKDLSAKKPQLFTKDAKGTSLNKKYVKTSIGEANHADFPSYYPNLIIWLSILYNQNLNYDRVEELFGQKSEYGKLMRDKSLSEEDRRLYKVLREGTKLLLNSASGAADATFENNIRNNNQIIAMRCIGQMFAWLIGQDLTLKGALVPSTNTDGLYTFMPKDENDKALKEETEKVGISIEAEQVGFVSKDSNNRMEINMDTGEVMTASGGTLGCWQGPNPAKALSHPAVVDWALSEYLVLVAENYQGADMDEPLDITKPLDREVGKEILLRAAGLSDKMDSPFDMDKRMLMFQNIIASSPSSHTYIYGVKDGDTEAVPLQHYNRIFLMSDGTDDTWHLQAAVARKVTPAMQKKRMKTGDKPTVTDLTAKFILDANGEDTEELHHTRDITTKKCTNLDPEWPIRIENRNLSLLSDSDKQDILDNLDFDKYVDLLESAYNHNWMNHTPGQDFAVEEENPEEDI